MCVYVCTCMCACRYIDEYLRNIRTVCTYVCIRKCCIRYTCISTIYIYRYTYVCICTCMRAYRYIDEYLCNIYCLYVRMHKEMLYT